jgi:DNA (cytosine-5)-methyltransferase 1
MISLAMADFTFIDLFAGIGGIRSAFSSVGGECVFTSEYDKFAKKTYEANYGEGLFWGDIRTATPADIPDHDVLLGGFPCQPFSSAGVSKKNSMGKPHGFLDQTQGTLFFDVARLLDAKKPRAFMLENVKNLMAHDGGKTFKVVYHTLAEMGYNVRYQILDSKTLVPQRRERVYIVGFRDYDDFYFPELPNWKPKLRNILEKSVDPKYTLTDKLWAFLKRHADKHKEKGNGFGYGMADLDGVTRTLPARYYKDGGDILVPQEGKNPRRLTPRECARLMGFPEDFKIVCSDTRAYKQFGNSVVVPVVWYIAREMSCVLKHGRQDGVLRPKTDDCPIVFK